MEKDLGIVNAEVTPLAIVGDYFTADAQLTAYFGASNQVAVSSQNTIRGMISNFENSKGDDVDFTITLNPIKFAAGDGTFMPAEDAVSVSGIHETDNGVSQSTSGTWKGQFFGPEGVAPNENTTFPTGVAGDFQAHFPDAHVVGAFGAKK